MGKAEISTSKSHRLPAQSCKDCGSSEFVQVVEQSPMAISITDMTANILYVNPAFCKVTGYSTQDLVGHNHSILSYKATPAHVYKNLWSQLSKGRCWQGRLVNRRKNGERYLADVIVSPIRNNAGEVTHFMGVHRDVTDTHEITTKLNNQQALVEAVLNAAPVAVALVNAEGAVVLDNLAYKTLKTDLGEEPADLLLAELKRELGEDALEQLTTRRYAEGHSVCIEARPRQPERWFYCRLSRLSVANSDVDGYFAPTMAAYSVLTVSEHTKEKRQQELQRLAELSRMTAEAETLHAMQETLHAAIHQMQGPMNMIQAAVGMLAARSEKCLGLEALNDGLASGANVLEQLQQALPERPQEAVQPTNLNQLIHEVSMMMTPRLLKLSIEMQLQLNATLPSIVGQPFRLRVALKQLIENAVDAIERSRSNERQILIRSAEDDEGVLVSVEDSGPGIPADQKIKVFQPFVSTKPNSHSGFRGIGLSIVQQVINEHAGTVLIKRSRLGGASVQLSLPKRSGGVK